MGWETEGEIWGNLELPPSPEAGSLQLPKALAGPIERRDSPALLTAEKGGDNNYSESEGKGRTTRGGPAYAGLGLVLFLLSSATRASR